jgi:hypothetical protein
MNWIPEYLKENNKKWIVMDKFDREVIDYV